MPEKPPVHFDISQDATLAELQSLVDQGFPSNAVTIAKFKLEELETVVADVEKIIQGDEGEISKDNWQVAKVDIIGQIEELKDFLEKN